DRGQRPSAEASASGAPTTAGAAPPLTSSPTAGVTRKNATPTKAPTTVASTGTCEVSFYDTGTTTASGEPFDPNAMTAANKTWTFGTIVRVTNLANGKSVDVRINDRGPYVSGRCIDLARGAFLKIASISSGVINAKYEVLK